MSVERAIGPDSVLSARMDVASVEIDGEIVMYDDAGRRLHRLNPTAAILWRCLDGSGSLADIASDVAEVYATDVSTVLAELVGLARRFADEGLLLGFAPSAHRAPGITAAQPGG